MCNDSEMCRKYYRYFRIDAVMGSRESNLFVTVLPGTDHILWQLQKCMAGREDRKDYLNLLLHCSVIDSDCLEYPFTYSCLLHVPARLYSLQEKCLSPYYILRISKAMCSIFTHY
jgi:hypothetical protein